MLLELALLEDLPGYQSFEGNEGSYRTKVVSYCPVLLLAKNEYRIEGGTG